MLKISVDGVATAATKVRGGDRFQVMMKTLELPSVQGESNLLHDYANSHIFDIVDLEERAHYWQGILQRPETTPRSRQDICRIISHLVFELECRNAEG